MNKERKFDLYKFFDCKTNQDKILFLLNLAVFAPSTHNSQPWQFKIKQDYCEIYYDNSKILPQADKNLRDLYISIGCLVENIIIASLFFNAYKKIEYIFRGNHVVNVYFDFSNLQINKQYFWLVSSILRRINTRGIFNNQKISQFILNDLSNNELLDYKNGTDILVKIVSQKGELENIAKLTAEGMRIAHSNKKFRKEASIWIVNNYSSKVEGIPGYALRVPSFFSFIVPWMIRFFNMGKILAKKNYHSIISAPAICIISSTKDLPEYWFDVGRQTEQVLLKSTFWGLGHSIFVAIIEMGLRDNLAKYIPDNFKPQILFAIGYIDGKFYPTPRQKAEEKLIK